MLYNDFIQNIIDTRGRFGCGNSYHERHHIIPKSIGGSNEESNLIDLFAQEHYEAHRLLALENPSNKHIQYAWWNMAHCGGRNCQDRYILTKDEYEEARITHSKNMSGKNNPNYGRKHTEEAKARISEARKNGTGYWKNKHLTEETKMKLSKNHKGKQTKGENPWAKKIVAEEIIYNSVVECAEHYGIKYDTMLHWFSRNAIPQKYLYLNLHYLETDKQTN